MGCGCTGEKVIQGSTPGTPPNGWGRAALP